MKKTVIQIKYISRNIFNVKMEESEFSKFPPEIIYKLFNNMHYSDIVAFGDAFDCHEYVEYYMKLHELIYIDLSYYLFELETNDYRFVIFTGDELNLNDYNTGLRT
jgi:hypothetical protein